MGTQPPTPPNDSTGQVPQSIMNAGVNAVVRAASSGPLPWRGAPATYRDEPMVINFARLVHITHATAMAGSIAG